jgi:amidohydrolase
MNVIPEIEAERDEWAALRRDIHAHPELAFEEHRTADLVAERLTAWGLAVHRGLARTGVVGTLSRGAGPAIGLRADLDALALLEANTFAHRSRFDGKMHACGHDGHTVMLLAAARYLAFHPEFSGTVHFIFQPAEEAAGGAKVMLADGLLEKFPIDAVFGMHNWPGLPAGHFAVRTGPMMASLDCFDISIRGTGTHGALPHHGVDPISTAALLVNALQTIVSRNVDPLQAAVVSVAKIHAGDTHNIIPERASLGGGIRCFDAELRARLKRRLCDIADGVASACGAKADVEFGASFPPLVNDETNTRLAAEAAVRVAGAAAVQTAAAPVLASEDFAYMLEQRAGCYLFIGNGAGSGSCMIHNPGYDFNDAVLPVGASYWVRLVQRVLGGTGA